MAKRSEYCCTGVYQLLDRLMGFCSGWVLMVVEYSRNFSPTYRKKCLIAIEDFGWPTRRTNFILTMAPTRHNVSIFQRCTVHQVKFRFFFKHIVSTGTDLLAEFWARHFTKVSWWTSPLPGSFSPRFVFPIFMHRHADAHDALTTVAGQAEFPRRPRLT